MGGRRRSSSQTIGYWYRLGCQTAVSHSPVDGVSQILVGERTAWSGFNSGGEIYVDKLDLFGGEKREGGVKGRIAINMGLPNQGVDRYVAAARGETSAQRGILTMVFGDGGSAPSSNLRAINFEMSSISQNAETKIGASPTGILTVVGREMTRSQAESYIGRFYTPKKIKYNSNSDDDDDELLEQYRIYGSYRAVTLMYAYRAFVLGNLPNARTNGLRFSASDFFNVEERVSQIDTAYSEPFWWSAMNPYFKALWVRVQNIFAGWTLPNGCWYREKASIAGSQYRMDNNSYLPINDMNPAHIIYNILTNNVWGMGYTASDIDEESFKAAADTLFNEKFGMSLAWRKEEVIEEFINIILKTIDAFLRVNVLTGKFQLVLIRGDYNIDKLPVIDENIIMKLEKYERSSWGDTPNEIVLTYRDRLEESAVITVQNLAAIETQGSVISTTVEYIGIHEPELAGRVAERELINASTPIAKVTMTVNRMAFLLQSGDVFNFKWKELGITQMAMRVVSINKGTFEDGTIQIEAVEDVFGLPSSTYVSEQENLWIDSSPTPVPITNAKVWEVPYYDIVHSVGEQAAQQGLSQGYTLSRLFVDMPNSGSPAYVLTGATRNNDSDYATVVSSASYQANFTLLDRISRTDTTFSISAVENMPDSITEDDYIVIDDEVMGIVKIDNTKGTMTVTRGNLDTIPEIHKVGTTGWIVKPSENQDETFRVLGETVYYKPLTVTTRGTLPIEQATPFSKTLIGRSDRPFPVAGVKFNGTYFPTTMKNSSSLRLTWDGRNRQMVKLNHWTYGNIQEEAGVTYDVKIYNPSTNKVFYNDVGLTVRDKTYVPPKDWYKFTLPTTIDGLVYHYDFESVVNGNEFAPVAGLGNAISYSGLTNKTNGDSVLVQGVLPSTKAYNFNGSNNLRLGLWDNISSFRFTVSFRLYNPAGGEQPLFYVEDDDILSSGGATRYFAMLIKNNTLSIYIGSSDSTSTLKMQVTLESGFHDLIVRLSDDKFDCWIDGVLAKTQSLPLLAFYNKYDVSGVINLYSRLKSSSGYITTSGEVTADSSNSRTSDYIPVTEGIEYVYQVWRTTGGSSTQNTWCFYDKNKSLVGSRVVDTTASDVNNVRYSSFKITPPVGSKYIRVSARELETGYAMFSEGSTIPTFNLNIDDFVKIQSSAKIKVGYYLNGSYGYANGMKIDDLFVYNRALTDTEINQINSVMIQQRWSEQVTVEMKTNRGNLSSWQTFKHTFSTTE